MFSTDWQVYKCKTVEKGCVIVSWWYLRFQIDGLWIYRLQVCNPVFAWVGDTSSIMLAGGPALFDEWEPDLNNPNQSIVIQIVQEEKLFPVLPNEYIVFRICNIGSPTLLKSHSVIPFVVLSFCKLGWVQVLCKPKIMPLKSITLERLEEMEKAAAEFAAQQQAEAERMMKWIQ